MSKQFYLFFIVLGSLLSGFVQAQTPSAEQMAIFKNLPADQQQALAKEYGVTLPSDASSSSSRQHIEEVEINKPRDEEDSEDKRKSEKEDDDKDGKEELSRFGVDLFANSPSTFAPTNDAPVPANYTLGAGDEIIVQFFGKENATHNLVVNREGLVQFPSLGPIQVAGMEFSQVNDMLTQRVKEQMIGVNSSISLGKLRSIQIFVMGDAYKPGAYTVSALTTISQAVYYSGGFGKKGALRNVQLKRNGKVIRTLDFYDLLLRGDTSNDARLHAGDVVVVNPVQKLVEVDGEINRPAIYELKPGETLSDLVSMAGGFSANAYLDKVNLKRYQQGDRRELITLNLNNADELNQLLTSGDSIEIKRKSEKLSAFVEVKGDVQHPGYFAWKPNLNVADLFSNLEAGINDTTDVGYAILVREVNARKDIEVLQLDLAAAILNPDSEDNLTLQNRDTLLVFNRKNAKKSKEEDEEKIQDDAETAELISAKEESESKHTRQALLAPVLLQLRQQARLGDPPKVVDIFGEIHHPGSYPLVENMSLASLIAASGGLTYEAYTAHAELSRVNEDPATEEISADIQALNLREVLAKKEAAQNIILKSGDRLNVLEKPDAKYNAKITLQGEVRFPGTYQIRRGETLSQLVERAGGLTKYAYAEGALFTREGLRKQETKLLTQYAEDLRSETAKQSFRIDKTSAANVSDPDKTVELVEKAVKSKALGRMVIELDKILDNEENTEADVVLEDGDLLHVPVYRNSVSIMGEVQLPISYHLDSRLSINDYIDKAGGMKKQADASRVYVIRADGSVYKPASGYWFGNKKQKLSPGDTIVVPLDTNYRDALSTWTAATQILYQTGVAIKAMNL